jgi:hypothetical protein
MVVKSYEVEQMNDKTWRIAILYDGIEAVAVYEPSLQEALDYVRANNDSKIKLITE